MSLSSSQEQQEQQQPATPTNAPPTCYKDEILGCRCILVYPSGTAFRRAIVQEYKLVVSRRLNGTRRQHLHGVNYEDSSSTATDAEEVEEWVDLNQLQRENRLIWTTLQPVPVLNDRDKTRQQQPVPPHDNDTRTEDIVSRPGSPRTRDNPNKEMDTTNDPVVIPASVSPKKRARPFLREEDQSDEPQSMVQPEKEQKKKKKKKKRRNGTVASQILPNDNSPATAKVGDQRLVSGTGPVTPPALSPAESSANPNEHERPLEEAFGTLENMFVPLLNQWRFALQEKKPSKLANVLQLLQKELDKQDSDRMLALFLEEYKFDWYMKKSKKVFKKKCPGQEKPGILDSMIATIGAIRLNNDVLQSASFESVQLKAPELASESLYTSTTNPTAKKMKQEPVEDNDQERLAIAAGSSTPQTPSFTTMCQSHSHPAENGKVQGTPTEDSASTNSAPNCDVCCAPKPDDCVSFNDRDDQEDWTPESEADFKLNGNEDEHHHLKETGVDDDDDKKEVLGESSFGQQSSQTDQNETNDHSKGSSLGPDALLQLCRTNQWDLILQHVQKDPRIAMTQMKVKGRTTTILHRAIQSEGNPEALKSAIAFILDKTPQALSIMNSWGNFPIHTLVAYHGMGMDRNVRLELLPKFINADKETLLKKGGSLKRTPLHAHLAGRSRPSLVKQMIDHASQACFMEDDQGWLPVHLACSNHCSLDTLRILLKANPSALHHCTKEGQTLLEVAVSTATKAKPHFALIDEIRLQMNQTSDPMESDTVGAAVASSTKTWPVGESLPFGTRVKRQFQEGWFEGTVVDKEGHFYEIRYDDGDVEKLRLVDMKHGMELVSFPKDKQQEQQQEQQQEEQQEQQVAKPHQLELTSMSVAVKKS